MKTLDVIDYSNRRGVLVPLFPKIHGLLAENAERDTLAAFAKPENIIFWKQRMGKQLLETDRHFMLAADGSVTDGGVIVGLMFFHLKNGAAYIDQLQAAWQYRKNPAIIDMMLDKFASNQEVKKCNRVFAGENIKATLDKELLASVGFKETFPDGWEPLGNVTEAIGSLKLRY